MNDNIGKEKEIERDLTELCKKGLPEYAYPIAYKFRKDMPQTAVGKIDYRAIEKE